MDSGDAPTGPVPAGRDPEAFDRLRRRVLWTMPTGLFVVGSRAGDRSNLMTANWVMQVATVPKLVAVSVETGAVTRRLIEEGRGFSVSLLAREDRAVVRRFVKPVRDTARDATGAAISMQGQPVREVGEGWPVLASAVGWLACALRTTCAWDQVSATPPPGGPSHVLFVGEVVDAGERDEEGVSDREGPEVLRMEDTRMSYGG